MSASRFYDGQQAATHSVRIFLFGRELRVVGENEVTLAVWRASDMRAAPEIDPDGVVTLTARGQPGSLLIDDAAALDIVRRAGVKLPGHRAWTRGHWIAVCATLLATLSLGVLSLTIVPRWLAAAIPAGWERRLGAPAEALMTASHKSCAGVEGQAALDRLVGRLVTAGDIKTPVNISVLDDSTVNAFTLPGGRVLVMRGLIARVDDGTELAGVIAHELGHVAHRDPTTQLLRGMGLSMLLHMLGLGDASNTAASGASNLMSLAYTREAESAADDTAIELLSKAGLRADGLSRFFAHMEPGAHVHDHPKQNGEAAPPADKGAALNWLSTHPLTAERRERTAQPETGEMPFTDAEWQAIRSMCASQ